MAVIAHTVVLTTHPHTNSSPEGCEREESGETCIQNFDSVYVTETLVAANIG